MSYHWHFAHFSLLSIPLLISTLLLPSFLLSSQQSQSRVISLTELTLQDKMADVSKDGEGGSVGEGNERVWTISD